MKKTRRSLAEYAAQRKDPRAVPCAVCVLPEAKEVNEAKVKGVKMSVIYEWLVNDCGYGDKVSNSKLVRHFGAGHHGA